MVWRFHESLLELSLSQLPLELVGWNDEEMFGVRTWLESVEADMAELEIDREDVHDRKKWRKNVMKMKSNLIGKRTINRYK